MTISATGPVPVLWLKADAGVSKDSSNLVSAWADQSGLNNTALQSDTSLQPTWVDAVINNLPVIRFNGAIDTRLQSSFDPGTTGMTVFYVAKTGDSLDLYPSLLGSGVNATPGIRWAFGLGSDMQYQQGYGWAGSNGMLGLGSDASLAPDTVYTMSYRTDKSQWTVTKNGVLANTVADTSFPTGTYQLTIGAEDNSVGRWPFTGDLAEVLVYNTALSDNDCQQVEAYLQTKYTAVFTECRCPTFTPAAGTYGMAQTVTISTTTSGANIRYTLDGSTPSETAGTLYSSPLLINTCMTVEAIAYNTGMVDSAVTTGSYSVPTAGAWYLDTTTQGSWWSPGGGFIYGSDGYVLCTWNWADVVT